MDTIEGDVEAWLAEYSSAKANGPHLLCDRHPPTSVAFTFVGIDMTSEDLTFGDIERKSRMYATALRRKGVQAGDRVPVMLGKRPELVVTLVALWRIGAVYVPLFTAFATGAAQMRIEDSKATLVITEAAHQQKFETLDGLVVLDIADLDGESEACEPDDTADGGQGPLVQLYTSGTTGKPKGVVVPVRALASFQSYLALSLDVRKSDVYWNAADPGWAYGLYYSVIGPMVAGIRSVVYQGGFTPESTFSVLDEFGITNFAGAPTMFRAMKASGGVAERTLRRISSAGEPLTPEILGWAKDALGSEVRDHYGQTELGMVICNHWADSVRRPVLPGSMGSPLPGYTAGIVEGQIAIDVSSSPLLWFDGYHGAPEKTAERFSDDGRWYLTADTGRVDEQNNFFFSARDDDVILAAGYRIGPFDVESVIVTHTDVSEVAVVGRPDPEGIRGEAVEAFVVLIETAQASDELAAELQSLVREKYSKHAYPRAVHFVESLPKTPSGKIQRFLLRSAPRE
ncbi:AMP-binding protein [Rhodococcus fascians]|nr:AMP-binding protein [Rhodococcus fascians]MBY4140981.1 AMP-binding protein [Rhodococcus fascians]MBY4219645.1 AMP-binding protein [Rhodococcus fascians]MBY4221954.1 AMP-binding protein [Rhodococcus fascians]MBY4233955.1 AMP-binding protein [Rhodococcus fascians]